MGVSTLKSNGSGGYMQGFELTASIPFSLFSDALNGFGFIVSGAKNDSSIKINDVDTPVPGLSTKVINSTLYYEKYGFSARVSNRYRDDFIGEVPAFDATLQLNNVSAESLVDAQIGYSIQGGDLKGLSFSLSGTNLTDEPFVLNNIDSDSVSPDQVPEVRRGVCRGGELHVRVVRPFARGSPRRRNAGGGFFLTASSSEKLV